MVDPPSGPGAPPAATEFDTRVLRDGGPREPVEEMQLLAELQHSLFGSSSDVTLSRYIVLERLGQGGAGVVYTAYDPELDRKVAIKLLNARAANDVVDDETRARQVREAQAMARLSHPNVIAVYDVGTYDENETRRLRRGPDAVDRGVPTMGMFVVMELVDGVNLSQWLDTTPRTWREVLGVFVAAGRGLAAAHRAGIVHRDFKPANVLVGNDGRVRVLDFGLARAVDDSPADVPPRPGDVASPEPRVMQGDDRVSGGSPGGLDTPLTQTGTVMGTPAYMAPEQHRGDARDEKVDQFSFCAALYQGLYGQLPFKGRNLEALANAKANGQVRLPPKGTRVPPWLHRIVMRGLEPDPGRRHGSTAELLRALERGAARPRRRAAVIVGAVALMAAAASAVVVIRPQKSPCAGQAAHLHGVWDDGVRETVRQAFDATNKPFAQATWTSVARGLDDYAARWVSLRTEVCEANLVADDENLEVIGRRTLCLDRRLTRLGQLTHVFSEADAQVVERAVEAVGSLAPLDHCAPSDPRMGGALPMEASVRAALLDIDAQLARAEALRHGGHYAEGVEVASNAVAAATDVGHGPTLTRTLLVLAGLRAGAGEATTAEAGLSDALVAAEQAGDHELALIALVDLVGVVIGDQARYAEGDRLARLAAAKLEYRGLSDELDAQLALTLGELRKGQGRYEDALAALAEARDLNVRIHGASHPQVATAINQVGTVLFHQAKYAEALTSYEQALALREEAFGADHPQVGATLNNVANIYQNMGRSTQALAMYERALGIYERSLGPEHPRTAAVHHNVGIVLSALGRHDEALRRHERGLQIRERALEADHPLLAHSYLVVGATQESLGRGADALESARRALRLQERTLGEQHPDVGITLNNVGSALALLGRHREALETHRAALKLREAALEPRHPDIAWSLMSIAEQLHALHRSKEAYEPLERALTILGTQAGTSMLRAQVEWLFARVLERTEKKRALELATAARTRFEASGNAPDELADVVGWLRQRGEH